MGWKLLQDAIRFILAKYELVASHGDQFCDQVTMQLQAELCDHAQFWTVPIICFMSGALQEVLGLVFILLFAAGLAWPLNLGVLGVCCPLPPLSFVITTRVCLLVHLVLGNMPLHLVH